MVRDPSSVVTSRSLFKIYDMYLAEQITPVTAFPSMVSAMSPQRMTVFGREINDRRSYWTDDNEQNQTRYLEMHWEFFKLMYDYREWIKDDALAYGKKFTMNMRLGYKGIDEWLAENSDKDIEYWYNNVRETPEWKEAYISLLERTYVQAGAIEDLMDFYGEANYWPETWEFYFTHTEDCNPDGQEGVPHYHGIRTIDTPAFTTQSLQYPVVASSFSLYSLGDLMTRVNWLQDSMKKATREAYIKQQGRINGWLNSNPTTEDQRPVESYGFLIMLMASLYAGIVKDTRRTADATEEVEETLEAMPPGQYYLPTRAVTLVRSGTITGLADTLPAIARAHITSGPIEGSSRPIAIDEDWDEELDMQTYPPNFNASDGTDFSARLPLDCGNPVLEVKVPYYSNTPARMTCSPGQDTLQKQTRPLLFMSATSPALLVPDNGAYSVPLASNATFQCPFWSLYSMRAGIKNEPFKDSRTSGTAKWYNNSNTAKLFVAGDDDFQYGMFVGVPKATGTYFNLSKAVGGKFSSTSGDGPVPENKTRYVVERVTGD